MCATKKYCVCRGKIDMPNERTIRDVICDRARGVVVTEQKKNINIDENKNKNKTKQALQ